MPEPDDPPPEHIPPPEPPDDLNTQLEALLDEVWADEANWRFDDRLDLGFKQPRRKPPK